MPKKIKLTAVIEAEDDVVLDESAINNSVGKLGRVESYNIGLDTGENQDPSAAGVSSKAGSAASASEISSFIRNSNKIYYGSLDIEKRKAIAITIVHVANQEKVKNDGGFRTKIISMFANKFEEDDSYVDKLLNDTNDVSLFEVVKGKFLEGDLSQMFIYIWEKILSKGEEDDSEVELIETTAEKFSMEKPDIAETKKLGNERAKISKAIDIINSGKTAYNKLKAFEKTVVIALMLTECSTIDGKISSEDLSQLRNLLNGQFNVSSNSLTVITERDIGYSLTKKVEQVEVYREKYELVEFLWERVLSTETEIKDGEMELIRKMVRRLDISDVESEGARKEVEANLG
ncbi:MAG: hypothetical protein CMM95_02780 [Rickettsiales bacterium]|nr:hypothetical protein [Rickettsiales bacterium]|tara:strand:- start:8 stop:1045 length:1038 start_codon:yes stop_codon:yes gene_type:complete